MDVCLAFRAGKGLGSLPFDELFMLGMERENDLQLRGHPVSYQGKKGNAFLGTSFLLFNSGFDKRVYQHPWFDISLGPLFDGGKTYDEPGRFASPSWLWDLGLQSKVRVRNGSVLVISYGKSLHESRSVWFVALSR